MVNYYNELKKCIKEEYFKEDKTAIIPQIERENKAKTNEEEVLTNFYDYIIEMDEITLGIFIHEDGKEDTDLTELDYAFLNGSGAIKNQPERDTLIDVFVSDGIDEEEAKRFIKDLERLTQEIFNVKVNGYDWLGVLKKSPTEVKALNELAIDMQTQYNIQGVNVNSSPVYYYEKENKDGSFTTERLDDLTYKDLVLDTHNLSIGRNEAKRSLESLPTKAKEQNGLWEFKNQIYLDTADYTIKDGFEDTPLTNRKFKTIDGEMLEYIPDVEIGGDNQTLMEKTYREILIPKNNPEDERLLYETLYLIGASLVQNNPEKVLPFWYAPLGNNGKSMIPKTIKMFAGNTLRELRVDKIGKDNFLDKYLDDSNYIVIDEIMRNSFNNHWIFLKRYTSGGFQTLNVRDMYTAESFDSNGIGTLFVFTNELPIIPNEDAIRERIHLIEPPNRFVIPEKDENGNEILGENEYKMDKKLSDKLLKDKEGLEWLISASIHTYKTYPFKKTSNEEIDNIIFERDTIKKFLYQNYEVDEQGLTTNSKIVEKLWEIPEIKRGYNKESLSKSIGLKIKEVFGEGLRIDNSEKAIYRLSEKSNEEKQ